MLFLAPTLLACALAAVTPASAEAQGALQAAEIVERLGEALPRELQFTNHNGDPASLDELIGGKPLVISLAYFTCPMLCRLAQEGAAAAFRDSGWHIGDDFRAVTLSIDPSDTPELARQWRNRSAAVLGVPLADDAWPFLVGDEASIRRLAEALGFAYAYDEETRQYAHASAVFIVGADGRLSRYLYGITFEGREMADALASGRENRRVHSLETFLMRCFHYVPSLRRHGTFVAWMLRITGLSVTLAVGSMLFLLWRRKPIS
ncbi:MAG: SCO family protein [Vicinamibacterales bacterium]